MCDVRIRVTAGIGQGGIYRCGRDHVGKVGCPGCADLSLLSGLHTCIGADIHEVYLGSCGATLRWDDAGWHWPEESAFEVIP